MSKVDELKVKYPAVTIASFSKFVAADTTPTKKYLDYMLRAWEDRKTSPYHRTSTQIIDYVAKFNELLPYIQNKDIYSPEYRNLDALQRTVDTALITREEKTFIREEHSNVLMETDKLLFIMPTTHRGSLKYGSGTRWCTASKNDPGTFSRYFRNGLLVYLIDKTETKTVSYRKVAFYHEYSNRSFNDSIQFYNSPDTFCNEGQLINAGWDEEELFEITMKFRYFFMKNKRMKKHKDYVDTFVNTLSQLDFTKFEEHIANLDETANISYISKAKEKVESFLESINKTKYGTRKTKD